MKLFKRFPNANIYDRGNGKFQAVLGGVPNVLNDRRRYVPLDNELKVITTHPLAGYVVKRGPFWIGFHDKVHNKYAFAVKLRTGESMIVTAIGDVACTPTIIDKRTIQWKYPNGSWIREYATEKEIKEVIHQKAGQQIKFKYRLTGLTVKKVGNQVDFYRGDKKAFSILRPYYCTVDGEFISYVPVSWQKVSGNWEVTYPAPASDCYIDPTLIFGEAGGVYIGGDHKDTYIASGAINQAFGSQIFIRSRTLNPSLIRWSLFPHIPTNAIVNTAIMNWRTVALGGANNCAVHDMITDWGITKTDEGVNQTPAVAGQATFRRSFDFNGAGGDVLWAGGNFGIADYQAAEVITALAANNTWYQWSIPIMAQRWITSDANNNGALMLGSDASVNNLDNSKAVNLANRPYLTVDYDVPAAPVTTVPISQRISRIAIHNSIGIK